MKIDEFTNKLSGVVSFTCDSKIIRIYANDWAFHHDDAFLVLDAKANNLINFEDWGECGSLPFDRLHEVLNLVQKLRDTPVSERFPEKKYRLRWLDFDNLGDGYTGTSHIERDADGDYLLETIVASEHFTSRNRTVIHYCPMCGRPLNKEEK